MNHVNKLLTSIIIYCLISYLLSLPNIFIGLLFSIIGSQISIILPKNYQNSLIILLIISCFSFVYPVIFIPISIGFLSNIFISLLSKNGCLLLYPFSSMSFTGPKNYLKNGSKEEKAVTTFLLVLAMTTIIFSLFGNEIISDINDNEGILNYYNNRNDNKSDFMSNHYGVNNSGYTHYVNIDAGDVGINKNITTIDYNRSEDNRTTTTIITEYRP